MIHIISTSTEKVGGGEIQKFEYLENEKNFLDFFKDFLSVKYKTNCEHKLKGCVCYIFASLFLSLNESTCQTEKNVSYFTSKALFVLKEIKFSILDFQIS